MTLLNLIFLLSYQPYLPHTANLSVDRVQNSVNGIFYFFSLSRQHISVDRKFSQLGSMSTLGLCHKLTVNFQISTLFLLSLILIVQFKNDQNLRKKINQKYCIDEEPNSQN